MTPIIADRQLSEFYYCPGATDTRSLGWFQLGDIGTDRKTILERLPPATVGPVDFEYNVMTPGSGLDAIDQHRTRTECSTKLVLSGADTSGSALSYGVSGLPGTLHLNSSSGQICGSIFQTDTKPNYGEMSGRLEKLAMTKVEPTHAMGQRYGTIRLAESLREIVAGVLIGAWSAIEGEKTRTIVLRCDSQIRKLGQVSIESERNCYPVADFYNPIDYSWSKSDFKVDRALKTFSEQTHADY